MIYKIKELINDGYTIEFGPYVLNEIHITISKNMYRARYIITHSEYSDLKNSIWDPDVAICQILDDLKSKVDDEILKNMWRDF